MSETDERRFGALVVSADALVRERVGEVVLRVDAGELLALTDWASSAPPAQMTKATETLWATRGTDQLTVGAHRTPGEITSSLPDWTRVAHALATWQATGHWPFEAEHTTRPLPTHLFDARHAGRA